MRSTYTPTTEPTCQPRKPYRPGLVSANGQLQRPNRQTNIAMGKVVLEWWEVWLPAVCNPSPSRSIVAHAADVQVPGQKNGNKLESNARAAAPRPVGRAFLALQSANARSTVYSSLLVILGNIQPEPAKQDRCLWPCPGDIHPFARSCTHPSTAIHA